MNGAQGQTLMQGTLGQQPLPSQDGFASPTMSAFDPSFYSLAPSPVPQLSAPSGGGKGAAAKGASPSPMSVPGPFLGAGGAPQMQMSVPAAAFPAAPAVAATSGAPGLNPALLRVLGSRSARF